MAREKKRRAGPLRRPSLVADKKRERQAGRGRRSRGGVPAGREVSQGVRGERNVVAVRLGRVAAAPQVREARRRARKPWTGTVERGPTVQRLPSATAEVLWTPEPETAAPRCKRRDWGICGAGALRSDQHLSARKRPAALGRDNAAVRWARATVTLWIPRRVSSPARPRDVCVRLGPSCGCGQENRVHEGERGMPIPCIRV